MDKARMKAISDGANMSTGGSNFDYVDTIKLERMGISKYNTKKPKGNNFIRIVAPDTVGAFAKVIRQHTHIGTNKSTFLCLKEMWDEECPICNHISELRRQNVSNNVIKELLPSLRFLLYVVDTTDTVSEEEGTKWFDCPISIYKAICTLSQERRTGEKIDPTDPVDGRDIEFIRKDGKRTDYTGFVLTKTEPIPESWYNDLPAFEEILLKPDPDEMLTAVSGMKSESSTSESEVKSDIESHSTRKSSESTKEAVPESRRVRRAASAEESVSVTENEDSDQAAAIKSKIEDVKNRRRSRSN